MPDATGAAGAPVVPGTPPPVGNPAAAPAAGAGGQAGQAGDPAQGSGDRQSEPDAKAFRDELKATKAANKTLLAELEALKTANLSAAEKQTRALADRERTILERETALQERSLSLSVRGTAQQLGFANPALAARLIDRDQLAFDGDGNPTNVEPLLKALLKSEPYLGASAARIPGIDQGARDGGGDSGLTLDDIKKMPQAEVMRRWPEVEAAMARGRT